MNTNEYLDNLWSLLEWDKILLLIFDEKLNLIRSKLPFGKIPPADGYTLDSETSPLNAKSLSSIKKAIAGKDFPREFKCYLAESKLAFTCHLEKVKLPDDTVQYYVLSSRMNSEIVRDNISLSEYENHFRVMFEKSPDGIFLMDKQQILDCNPAAELLFGLDREMILKSTPYDLSPEYQPDGSKSSEKAIKYINKALEGNPVYFEWQHLSAGKIPFTAEITLTPVITEERTIIQAFIKDISVRKNNEIVQKAIIEIGEAANEAENLDNLYRTIHQIIAKLMLADNLYIALYNESKNIISFPYFVDQFDEQPQSRHPGKGFTEYVLFRGEPALLYPEHIEDLYAQGIVNLLGSESIDWLGVPLKVKGKCIGVIAVQSYDTNKRYTKADENMLSFVSTQIASVINRKQYEDKILESEKKFKEMNAGKDRLFSIIAHDLKSPFTALLGFSEMMSVEAENLSKEEVKSFSDSIFKVAKNVHNLLENLLHWSRFQTGRFTFKPEPLKIKPLFTEVINLFVNNAKAKGITLTGSCSVDTTAYGDIGMVQSTLRNLISNAIKFTGNNGWIDISTHKDENFLYISVKDNGVGIAKSNFSKLFSIDDQYTTSGTSNEKGTGLGLLLSKEMVEKNGGTIEVESTRGKGSTFTFSLPLVKEKQD